MFWLEGDVVWCGRLGTGSVGPVGQVLVDWVSSGVP